MRRNLRTTYFLVNATAPMEKHTLPRHLLRAEWQLLRMKGDFDIAIRREATVRLLESSARARAERDAKRVDLKRIQAGDED